MQRSYYHDGVATFLSTKPQAVLGELVQKHGFDLNELQRNAWVAQINILQQQLQALPDAQLYFEFAIPRMGKRVDNIVLLPNAIVVLEFKIGAQNYPQHAKTQVIDYCLDLLNFHAGSHGKRVVPVLVCSQAPAQELNWGSVAQLHDCVCCNQDNLGAVLQQVAAHCEAEAAFESHAWAESAYKPTPTIIEAARFVSSASGCRHYPP
ncbi:hypothetical protein LVJ82_14745 [Vitreoscilla massiliensis]|uniref:Uncharacterized protein n=1 Tax=Vitreoscilla massiliensis TaxID=1689272 RepID=A0ABY4DYV6_9NEIS|nr:hypothetical protein [Vitreoscilla massiliensis]UOO88706.1 hypothetical protein LVJ82_14745 [Vitreoscilla massiliensis]